MAQTQVMALKFLNADSKGGASQAALAINYTNMMRTEQSVNIRVTNNSWGVEAGFNQGLYDSIAESEAAGILFVAAAGNGNILGEGADLDEIPFYPASFDLENIIAVAARPAGTALKI